MRTSNFSDTEAQEQELNMFDILNENVSDIEEDGPTNDKHAPDNATEDDQD